MKPLPDDHARVLAQKLYDGQLTLFVGAGLSHLAPRKDGTVERLPLWNGLKDEIAERVYGKDVQGLSDPLELFDSIVYAQERATLETLIREFLDDTSYEPSRAHEALKHLPWAAVCSTNYDQLLARLLQKEPIVEERDYDRVTLSRKDGTFLFQIHGTLQNPHTLTKEDYRLWEEKHPRAFHELKNFFLKGTVLFVGYGMGDPHIDQLGAKIRDITRGREKRFYAWLWQASPQYRALLDRRDKIEAISLDRAEDWQAAFEQLREALDALGEPARARPRPSVDDPFSYDRAQYCAAIETRYGVANLQALYLPGAGYARKDIRLEDIFVEPDLERTDSRSQSSPVDPRGRDSLRAYRERELQEDSTGGSQREPASRRLARERLAIVIGAPGQGKSTLLRHMLLQAAARWRDQPSAAPLPIYLRLSEWESTFRTGLLDMLEQALPRLGEIGSNAVAAWKAAPIMWLLDGVDEVRDPALRSQLCNEIAATAQQRPNDRWVVTSRPAGDPTAALGPTWARSELSSLSDTQVRDVLRKWSAILRQKEGTDLDVAEVMRALTRDPGLRRLRGNALLLTLAVLFFKAHYRLPTHRYEFYAHAEKALRDAWVRHRNPQVGEQLPDSAYLGSVLERLALSGMRMGVVLFAKEEVERVAREVLNERGYRGSAQDAEVTRLLRSAEDLIGVLMAQGPERFGFLHLTFQEFYAARALVNRSAEAARLIAQYWDHPDWEEVSTLYALGIGEDESRMNELFKVTLEHSHPLDERLYRPQLACLRWCGLGSCSWGSAAREVLTWAGSQLEEDSYCASAILEVLSRWERSFPVEGLLHLIIKSLSSGGSFQQRSRAARALVSVVKEPEVRVALLDCLGDEDWRIRWTVSEVLGSVAGEAEVRAALLDRLGDEDWGTRTVVAGALGSVAGEAEVRAALLVRLGDEDWGVRCHVAEALGSIAAGDAEVRAVLLGRLRDAEPNVRWIVADMLRSAAKDAEMQTALLGHLNDEDSDVRAAAAQALEALAGEVEVGAALLVRLSDEDSSMRAAAARALGVVAGESEVRAALLARLGDQDREVRAAVAQALGSLAGEPEVRAALLIRLRDEDSSVRVAAAHPLGAVAGEPDVRAALLVCLGDGSGGTRAAAAQALISVAGEAEVRAALLAYLHDEHDWVVHTVVAALGSIAGEAEVRAALLARLGDPDSSVRAAVARALESVAGEPEVRAALLARLEDEDDSVRAAVARGLTVVAREERTRGFTEETRRTAR